MVSLAVFKYFLSRCIEAAIADNAGDDGTPLLVQEGFRCGRGYVPTVARKCPTVEVAAFEVEENNVFARRGGLRIGRLGKRKHGEDGKSDNESETVKTGVGKHGEISLRTKRAMMTQYIDV